MHKTLNLELEELPQQITLSQEQDSEAIMGKDSPNMDI